MPSQILAIARNAFVESLRQPVMFVLVALSGICQVFNTWTSAFSMGLSESGEVEGDNKMLLDLGMGTIFVIATVLAGFISTAVLSREIENKTALMVISKPVSRPVVVIGKYLGVAGAMLIATITMVVFLLLGIRHEVMSAAWNDMDFPVIIFGVGGACLSLLIAAWCNFYYGWSFPQAAVVLLCGVCTLGYTGILFVNKEWHLQHPLASFKPQITLACACLVMAVLVLTAVATAASTRLGQVMTIVVCALVFLASLLSNQFIGRHAFSNSPVGQISTVEPVDPLEPQITKPGTSFQISLIRSPSAQINRGATLWYGPAPSGFPLAIHNAGAFSGDPANTQLMTDPQTRPSVAISEVAAQDRFTIRSAGSVHGANPQPGDYVFLTPTSTNRPALAAWAIVPNMHFFWLLDAITQNNPIPPAHVGLVIVYALCQIGALLCLAVILFQRRDVA